MAKYGWNALAISLDNAAGSPVVMTPYVTGINSVDVEHILEELTPAGVAWEAWAAVGLGKMGTIELSGAFDDTATTGPNVIFYEANPATKVARTLLITWGGTKTTSCEVYIGKYSRAAAKGELTKYTVTLQPTGTVTEA